MRHIAGGFERQFDLRAASRRSSGSRRRRPGSGSPDPRLLTNLDRARALPAGGRFICGRNAATQKLTMYDNGQPVDSMKVIVGMHDLPTPMIASMIHYITYNPYWNVPFHLVRKTIAPNVLKQGLGYLKSHGYEVMADWSENLTATIRRTNQLEGRGCRAKSISRCQNPGPRTQWGI